MSYSLWDSIRTPAKTTKEPPPERTKISEHNFAKMGALPLKINRLRHDSSRYGTAVKISVSIEPRSTSRLSLHFWNTDPIRTFLAVIAAVLFSTGAAQGQETNSCTRVANQLVSLINAGNYAGIQTNFNKEMDAALPLDKSKAFFRRLSQQAGRIQKLGEPRPEGVAMVYSAKFERGTFDMQIALDDHGLIAGLLFKPHTATKPALENHQAQLDRYTKVASQLVELINAGSYASIQAKFNKEMDTALPLDKLTEFFKGLTQQAGKIQKIGPPQPAGEGMVFPAEFEKAAVDMQLALDGSGRIAGLTFTPHAPAKP